MNDVLNKSPVAGLSSRGRVLFADDEAAIRVCVIRYLTNAGYTIVAVADGQQAWEALQTNPYDLLIIDQQMPGFTGAELIARMRFAGINIPVIVAASELESFNRTECDRLKIAVLLQKPFSLDEFQHAINHALSPLLAQAQPESVRIQLTGTR